MWRKDIGRGELLSIQQTVDGGFILGGIWWDDDLTILKLEDQGNEEWRKSQEYGYSGRAQQNAEGGFYFLMSSDPKNIKLLKVDGLGNLDN